MGLENIVNCVKELFNKNGNYKTLPQAKKEWLLQDLYKNANDGNVEASENFMRTVLPHYSRWMDKTDYKELEKESGELLQNCYKRSIEDNLSQANEHAYNGSVPGAEKCIELALHYAEKAGIETGDAQSILNKAYGRGAYVQNDLAWNYATKGNVAEAEKCVHKMINYAEKAEIETGEEKDILQTAYERGAQEQLKKARHYAKRGDVDSAKRALGKINQYSKLAGIELDDVELKGIEKDAYRNISKNGYTTNASREVYNPG